MNVKGKGKPRSRRQPKAAGAAGDATPGADGPESSPAETPEVDAPALDEAATSQVAEVRAPRVRDVGERDRSAASPPAPRPDPERTEAEGDAVGEVGIEASERPPVELEADLEAPDAEAPVAEPTEPPPSAGYDAGTPPPPAVAERDESRRERRARELADEAAAIEAAALGERRRSRPSRRDRRAQERAEAIASEPTAEPVGQEDSRADRPAPEPSEAVPAAPPRAAKKESRRGRRAKERRAAVGEGASPAAARGAPPPLTAESQPRRARTPASRASPPPDRPLPPKSTSGRQRVPPDRPLPPRSASGPPRGPRPGPRPPRAVVLRQRRRRRRTIIGTTIFLVVFNLLVGGTYAYFQWRLDQINRVRVPGLDDDVPGQVMNVLLVGSDSRERLTGSTASQLGKEEVEGERSDTIMVLHVDPGQQKAAILSIPRDLYVPIAGTDRSDRVNTAFTVGGPEGLITTLGNMGIQVNHYAEVDFIGFREIVDAVGGVTVFSAAPARDSKSGLDIPRSGCVELNGTQALAYVRSRQYETLIDGNWVSDPRGDLGRIERQQDFIRRVMKEAVSTGISNPITLNRLIGIGVKNLTVDASMSTSDITHVARRFRSVDPDSVETLVLPTAPQVIEGKDVLVLKVDEAQDEIAKINGLVPISPPAPPAAGTTPTSLPASAATLPFKLADLRIQVLNGNGVKGSATTAGEALKRAGFTVVGTGDAPATARTLMRYRPGQQAKAQVIQNGLEVAAQLREDATLRATDVVLLLGADYKGFKTVAAPAPGASAPAPAPPRAAPTRPC